MEVLENPLLERELNRINMNILEVSYAKIDSSWRMQHVISPFIRLYFVQSGEACIRYRERQTDQNISSFHQQPDLHADNPEITLPLRSGNIYLIPSNLEFSYWCDGHMSKLYAHLNLLGCNYYDLLSTYPRCIILENRQTEIDELISWWQRGDILSSISIKTCLYQTVLEALLKEHISLGEIETYSDLVKNALKIIRDHPHLSLTAQKLAGMLFVSPSQLQKKFRQEVHVSLGRYLNEQVMFAAVNLLRVQERSIKEISDSLGFCDQFHFSRRFCEYYGMAPSRYRRSILL